MNRKNKTKRSLGICILSFLVLLLLGNFVLAETPAVDNETCLECHDGMDQTLLNTPHQLQKDSSIISCIFCHKGGEKHIEDPSKDNILNPQNATGLEALQACTSCHDPHTSLDNFGVDVHKSQGLNCVSCHNVHGGKKSLLLDEGAKFCLKCHSDIKEGFTRRSNHPMRQGIITCLNCHKFARETNNDWLYDMNRVCQDCHPEQGGPFLYEHTATTSYNVGGEGCVECHNPHGTENDHLLYQTTDNLCETCHWVPDHKTAHPAFAQVTCTECHTDIHGSFVSNKFLDPNLPMKFNQNCYDCHQLVD